MRLRGEKETTFFDDLFRHLVSRRPGGTYSNGMDNRTDLSLAKLEIKALIVVELIIAWTWR